MSNYQLNPSTVSLYSEKIMLKAMFEHKLFSEFFRDDNYRDDDVAFALGLPAELEKENELKPIANQLLKSRYQALSEHQEQAKHWETAYQNLAKLTAILELDETEQTILKFVFHFRAERVLRSLFEYFPTMGLTETCEILASLLDLKTTEIKRTLHLNGKLHNYGLVKRNSSPDSFHEYLRWGSAINFDSFMDEEISEKSLIEGCCIPTTPPTLKLSHYDHIAQHREMMLNYLDIAVKSAKKGVNILLYGKAGTGKTEFASLLANTLNIPSYTMASQDKDGDVLSGTTRLAQKLLAGKSAVIIFDEVEDVFVGSFSERSVAQEHKAWVNDFLENNAIPMIWISNSVGCIDNAYLRRFDMIFEMPMLPNRHKETLISGLVGNKLSADYIRHFAQNPDLSPAVLTRTLNVMNELPTENAADFAEKALGMFNQTLTSQGFRKIDPLVEGKISYNLDWVGCREDLHKISEGLKKTKRGRICCYGPPGTGKTAWANWLAQEMGLQALICQGSDLLSPYVGETEQNIARAFNEAKENNKVLILDEVDTFLFARENGQRSWEKSQVNEMLTQLEKFEGLLVVSTNLMESLDPAALRRFDLKLHFGYLNTEQRQNAAISQAEKLGLALSEAELARFQHFDNLTMGDFAAVSRRHRFAPFENAKEWIDALEAELALKPEKNESCLDKWLI